MENYLIQNGYTSKLVRNREDLTKYVYGLGNSYIVSDIGEPIINKKQKDWTREDYEAQIESYYNKFMEYHNKHIENNEESNGFEIDELLMRTLNTNQKYCIKKALVMANNNIKDSNVSIIYNRNKTEWEEDNKKWDKIFAIVILIFCIPFIIFILSNI